MLVYKIINLTNEKVYIGKTIDLANRKKKHRYHYQKGTNRYLYDAMRKYGITHFKYEVIEYCDSESEMNEREIFWISNYNSNNKKFGYNMTTGGDGGDVYSSLPPARQKEMGRRISEANTGRKVSSETRKKIGDAHRGKTLRPETKAKIRKTLIEKGCKPPLNSYSGDDHPMWGQTHTEEVKQHLRELREGKTYNEIYGEEKASKIRTKLSNSFRMENNPNYKEIDPDTLLEFIQKDFNLKEIADEFEVKRQTIHNKLKTFFNATYNELRDKNGLQRKDSIVIPKSELKRLVKAGRMRKSIADYFNTNTTTISQRIYKYWGMTYTELKKELKNG